MAKKKAQEKKKKERERKSKETVARQRQKIRDEAKKRREEVRAAKKERPKRAPLKNPQRRSKHDEEILAKLRHNMKILEALEQEYDKEMAAKQKLQAEIEAQEQEALRQCREEIESEAAKEEQGGE